MDLFNKNRNKKVLQCEDSYRVEIHREGDKLKKFLKNAKLISDDVKNVMVYMESANKELCKICQDIQELNGSLLNPSCMIGGGGGGGLSNQAATFNRGCDLAGVLRPNCDDDDAALSAVDKQIQIHEQLCRTCKNTFLDPILKLTKTSQSIENLIKTRDDYADEYTKYFNKEEKYKHQDKTGKLLAKERKNAECKDSAMKQRDHHNTILHSQLPVCNSLYKQYVITSVLALIQSQIKFYQDSQQVFDVGGGVGGGSSGGGAKVGLLFPDPNYESPLSPMDGDGAGAVGEIFTGNNHPASLPEDDQIYMQDIESCLEQLQSFNLVK